MTTTMPGPRVDLVPDGAQSGDAGGSTYWWAQPARLIGRLHPTLGEAVRADGLRLRQLPALVGAVILPALAIGLPLLITALHFGTAPYEQPIPDLWTLKIYDVFTESLLFMATALLIGIASPAAGALLVLVFGVGNLAVTVVSGELEPPLGATFGRLVSYALLWLLAVELPLLGRMTVEQVSGGQGAGNGQRWLGTVFGSAVIGVAAFAWTHAAPLLITVVYFTTARWGNPFLAAVQPLQANDLVLVGIGTLGGVILLGLRYLGTSAPFSRPRRTSPLAKLPAGGFVLSLLKAGAAVALLSGVVSQPIDLAVLGVALIAARPVARFLLSATKLAAPMSQVPQPVRLALGFGAAVGISWVLFSVFGFGAWSRFSTAVIAIAIGIVVIALFTTADEVAQHPPRPAAPASIPTAIFGGSLMLAAIVLAFPGVALADNCGDASDCFADLMRAALAAAGAAVAASCIAGAVYPHGRTREIKPGDWIPVDRRWYDGDQPWTPTQEEWDQMAADHPPTNVANGPRG